MTGADGARTEAATHRPRSNTGGTGIALRDGHSGDLRWRCAAAARPKQYSGETEAVRWRGLGAISRRPRSEDLVGPEKDKRTGHNYRKKEGMRVQSTPRLEPIFAFNTITSRLRYFVSIHSAKPHPWFQGA
jgi:hypothetical protein